ISLLLRHILVCTRRFMQYPPRPPPLHAFPTRRSSDLPVQRRGPRLELPERAYVLYRGDLAAALAFMDSEQQTPNLWWPADRAWRSEERRVGKECRAGRAPARGREMTSSRDTDQQVS